jgi:hypothetical protein
MTFEVLYNEARGSVKTAEIDAPCLLEAEAKFKEAHPEAVYFEIGVDDAALENEHLRKWLEVNA